MGSSTVEEELGWFRKVGLKLSGKGEELQTRPATLSPSEFAAFDLADMMEQGLAREVSTSFINPLPKEQQTRRLVMQRSADQCEFLLASQDGEPLLLARSAKGSRQIEIHIPMGGSPPVAVGPAFTLAADDEEHGNWTLRCERCDCCDSQPLSPAGGSPGCRKTSCRREIAHIFQERRKIGKGNMMCMEVDVPAACQDGTSALWCPRTQSEWSRTTLASRQPTWSDKAKCLCLDFYGRAKVASAKNIQLEILDSQEICREGRRRLREPELLFGKVSDNEFVLDYSYPLGMAQAFAIALSTRDWR
jgi:hypothetical protein